VTGIRWDYDSSIIEAFISPADGLPPRHMRIDPVSLPPSTSPTVALADAMWDEINAAHLTRAR
jgi:hypothetical protein